VTLILDDAPDLFVTVIGTDVVGTVSSLNPTTPGVSLIT
jgi:hypothetical protein